MWIFTPRYLKEAKHFLSGARKLLAYRRDILPPKDRDLLEESITSLKRAIKARDREAVEQTIGSLDKLVGKIAPPARHAGWRENCEVLLVAVVIAAGVRAYFLQPFKIPTGSMQPTLYGIVGTPSDDPAPNPVVRAWDLVVRGRNFIELKSKHDDTVVAMRERTLLNFFTFTDILTEQTKYTLFSPLAPLQNDFGLVNGRIYRTGQTMVRGYVQTGDQVFVDKMSYHFVRPELSEVFVFKTTGIRRIEATLPRGVQSHHYIKRLAGMPGDVLRIDPPDLFINGEIATAEPFRRVMSEQDGYRGYSNGLASGFAAEYLGSPEDTFKVPARAYFALGDNSYNSSDSRNWGSVPQDNVTGRGFVVYWPFSERWGRIK